MSTFFPRTESPRSNLYLSHYSFSSPKQLHSRCILNHPFNQKVQVFLPIHASTAAVSRLTQALQKNTHYYTAKIPLSLLLTATFMCYIREGLVALSVESKIDTSDVVCVDGKGKLILSLTKDSYEQFGMTGSKSRFHPQNQRYIVEINLRDESMIPGKAGFERIKWCFENTLVHEFQMAFTHVDSEGASVSLEFPPTVCVKQLQYTVSHTQLSNLAVPDTSIIRTIGINTKRWAMNVEDVYEWIGLASIQSTRITLGDKTDPYFCVYSTPCKSTADGVGASGSIIEITGFIPPSCVHTIFDSLRSLLDILKSPTWANVTVWGFQDSPISWIGKEHGYSLSGENMYSFFLWSKHLPFKEEKEEQDSDAYVMIENVGEHDAYC